MSINGVSFNPYLYTGVKAANNAYRRYAQEPDLYSTNSDTNTVIPVSNEQAETQTESLLSPLDLRKDIEETKSHQGLIGRLWDGFKNLTGIGAGSSKALKAIDDYESGKISKEEMNLAVDNYKQGQKQCVDLVADIASGIAAFGAFALATGIGLAASPFTGGASLGLVAAGFGIAGAAGAAVKVGVKGIDCAVGGRKYDTLGYDLATGGINGMFAPITAGIGGAAGKAVAGRVGVTALREGGEVIVKEALVGTTRGALAKTLLTTNVKYIGGSLGARVLALGTDMAVNGAITGAVDAGTRYLAGDTKDKSFEGFAKEVGAGTLGGFIMAPIIGGGMRLAGNGIGKLTGKLRGKVSANYAQAKSAMMNTPVVDNPDMEVLRQFNGILTQMQEMADDAKINGFSILDNLDRNLFEYSDNVAEVISKTSAFNAEIDALSKENRALVIQALQELSEGKDVSAKLVELTQRGISLADTLDSKVGIFSEEVEDRLVKAMAANEAATQTAAGGIKSASRAIEQAGDIVEETIEQARKIPQTNAFKQLGDMPDRAREFYSSVFSDVSALDRTADAAREKIISGNVQEGLEDLSRYYDEVDLFSSRLQQRMTSVQSCAQNSGLEESAGILRERMTKLRNSEDFLGLTANKQLQATAEETNILFPKFAQTFSGEDNLPPQLKSFLKEFTDNGITFRTNEQAQELVDELYGAGKYTILKSLKAGSVGEAYKAKTADNTEVIIKIIKDGVTPEKFAQDRAMFTRYVNEFVVDPVEKEYKLNMINSMFDAWDKELDLGLEAQNARQLVDGATRFNAAQTIEVAAKNGQNISMVQEKAQGFSLKELLEMVKLYKADKDGYIAKYSGLFEEYPALETPELWIDDLGVAFQKAQNEQVMFVAKSGTRTIHGDPHMGNVFVSFDEVTGKPLITYIDMGNVVQRTNYQTLQNMGLSLNIMIGNSQGIADTMLEGAILPKGANKADIAKRFAQLLDERLFKANIKLTDAHYSESTINAIMKELNVIVDPANTALFKATLTRVETSRAINSACGTGSNRMVDIKDLLSGFAQAFRYSPKETWQTVKPIMQWAYKNNDQAMQTFFQVLIKSFGTQV